MKKNLPIPSLAMALTLCTGACQSQAPTPPAVEEPPQPPPPASAASLARKELAGLDRRTPVPLQPMMAWHQKQNMMDHLVAIQRIAHALAEEDWEEVASASSRLESSPQMQQMCRHMGAGAPGFTEMALDFHRRADAIGVAARAHDTAAVLRATANTLQSCTTCHSNFRQEVVSATEWQHRAGSEPVPAVMHGEH